MQTAYTARREEKKTIRTGTRLISPCIPLNFNVATNVFWLLYFSLAIFPLSWQELLMADARRVHCCYALLVAFVHARASSSTNSIHPSVRCDLPASSMWMLFTFICAKSLNLAPLPYRNTIGWAAKKRVRRSQPMNIPATKYIFIHFSCRWICVHWILCASFFLTIGCGRAWIASARKPDKMQLDVFCMFCMRKACMS